MRIQKCMEVTAGLERDVNSRDKLILFLDILIDYGL